MGPRDQSGVWRTIGHRPTPRQNPLTPVINRFFQHKIYFPLTMSFQRRQIFKHINWMIPLPPTTTMPEIEVKVRWNSPSQRGHGEMWHLVMYLSHFHLFLLFFRLFTQVYVLTDGSVESQYITIIPYSFIQIPTVEIPSRPSPSPSHIHFTNNAQGQQQ